jgi:Ice-binding-like
MNRFESVTKPLRWFMALLLVAFVAGCGSSGGSSASSAKAISAYSLAGVAGTITGTAPTYAIAVTVPYWANVKALIATFTTTGSGVPMVGTMAQVSGKTPNDFTNSKAYIVTAADGTTATYTVTVTVAANSAKAITAYSLAGVTGTIDKTAKTIAVTMPFGTNKTALIATFTTTGLGKPTVTVSSVVNPQTSGTTPNDFTNPVAYLVTAADGSMATYTVTVTVALFTDKAITAYSLAGVAGVITEPAHTIAVTVPFGTNKTALVATFTTTGSGVPKVGTMAQASGTTANDFTSPVAYIVTAADASTATYTVTVSATAAAGPAPVDLGTAGNFVILAKTAVSTTGATAVVGDIGVSPAATSYLTGFSLTKVGTTSAKSTLVTGTLYGADMTTPTNSMLTTAVSDMETAFTDAAGRTVPAPTTELGAGDISGMTLAPGIYKWGTGVYISGVGVTLAGGANDVWIFQIAQDLTVSNGAMVTLSGGALAKNIFWQVSGQATLGTTVDFKGIILSQTLISLNTGAVLHGKALAQTAVTLDASTVGP